MSTFSALHWFIFALFALVFGVLVVRMLRRLIAPARGRAMVCTTCGHHGPTRQHTRGSLFIELMLWMLFLVPGLIYSVWRLTTRAPVCGLCGSPTVVPADSPKGRKLLLDASAQ